MTNDMVILKHTASSLRPRVAWQSHLLVLGCFTILALIVTYPLILHLDQSFVGNRAGAVDGYMHIWNLWWTAQALKQGVNPFFTPLLFYPEGLDLFWLWLSLPQGLLAFPITVLFGPLVAYNVVIIASYVFGGYAAFLFAHYIVGDWRAALVAGTVYAFSPFHMAKVLDSVMDTAAIQWVPCYLLILHMLLARPRWYLAVFAGLALLWVGLGSWYYGLFCLMYTGMAAVLWMIQPGTWRARVRWLAWGLAPMVIWLALMLPRLISMVETGDTMLGIGRVSNVRNSADIVSFWLPSPFHPFWGDAIVEFYGHLHPDAWLWQISFGLVGSCLAILGIRHYWRTRWRYLVLLGATMLLAMGETLLIAGWDTGFPLPYKLLAGLPGIRVSHRPNHIVILSILLVALFAAFGVAALLRRWPTYQQQLTIGIVLAIFLVDGWSGQLPLVSNEIPAAYTQLGRTDGAILPIPMYYDVASSEHLWYQTMHGWPIIGGYTGRQPAYPMGVFTPGIRELRFGQAEHDDILQPGWPTLALDALAAYKIRFVVFHPDTMGASLPHMRGLMQQLGLRPTIADTRIEVYPVPARNDIGTIAYFGEGWSSLERQDDLRSRWMSERAELRLFNPSQQPEVIRLDLRMEAFLHARPLTLWLDRTLLGTLQVSRGTMDKQLWLFVPPGEHILSLEAPAQHDLNRTDRTLSIAFLHIGVHNGSLDEP